MKVLAIKYGLVQACQNCHALLSYNAADIYEGKYIYCPVCKQRNEVTMVTGNIKKESDKDNEKYRN